MSRSLTIAEGLESELQAVEAVIAEAIRTEKPLLDRLGDTLLAAPGKGIRATLLLLAARVRGGNIPAAIPVAAVVELIHAASLIFDDLMDATPLRRGQPTLGTSMGTRATIVFGLHLFARAYRLLGELGSLEITGIITDTIGEMVEAEAQEVAHRNDLTLGEAEYFAVIKGKTASLFATACRLGGVLSETASETVRCLEAYGRALGTTYQLVDDLHDLDDGQGPASSATDLGQGIVTLPAIYALARLTSVQQEWLRLNGLAYLPLLGTVAEGVQDAWKVARRLATSTLTHLDGLEDSWALQRLRELPLLLVDAAGAREIG